MLELAIKGGKKYYGWLTFLLVLIGVGFLFYLCQLDFGLGITGLSRDASWGFYIANFTFLVGVAAGGVMVVLPYYLHDYKAFGKVTILGEFLAISSVLMCVTFILVDLGQPRPPMPEPLRSREPPCPRAVLDEFGPVLLDVAASERDLDDRRDRPATAARPGNRRVARVQRVCQRAPPGDRALGKMGKTHERW